MSIKDLTVENVADYLRIDEPTDSEKAELTRMMTMAEAFVVSYTGRTKESVESIEDLTYAWLALVADMYEQRQYQISKSTVKNDLVLSILDMYSSNLIPYENEVDPDA